MAAQLKTELTLKDKNFSAQLNSACKKAQNQLQSVSQASGLLGKSIGGTAGQISGLIGGFSKMAGPMAAATASIAAIGAGLKDVVENGAKFELALDHLQSLTGVTADKMENFKTQILDTAVAIHRSASEVADAYGIVGSKMPELLQNEQALDQVVQSASILSKAANMDLQTSIENLTNIMNQMGATSMQADQYINTLAAGSKNGAGNIQYLSEAFTKAGTNMAAANISFEEGVAMIEALSKKFPDAAVAGTRLNKVILALETSNNDKYKPSVVTLSTALHNLREISGDTATMTKMFGTANVSAARTLADMADEVDILTEKVTGTSEAYDQAAINTDNLASKTEALKVSWENFTSALGNGIPVLKNVYEWLAKCLDGWTKLINAGFDMGQAIKTEQYNNELKRSNNRVTLRTQNAGLSQSQAYLEEAQIYYNRGKQAYDAAKATEGRISKLQADRDAKKRAGISTSGIDKEIEKENKLLKSQREYISENNKVIRDRKSAYQQALEAEKKNKDKKLKDDDTTTTKKGGKSTGTKTQQEADAAKGSLKQLEKELSDYQRKFQKGLLPEVSVDEYLAEVNRLENEIKKERVRLKLDPDPGSLAGLRRTLQDIDNQIENLEPTADPTALLKLREDTQKSITDLEVKLKLQPYVAPDSLRKMEEDYQEWLDKVERGEITLTAAEIKIEDKNWQKKLADAANRAGSTALDDLQTYLDEFKENLNKQSSFDIAVGIETPDTTSAQLDYIQSLMDKTDDYIEKLKETIKAEKEKGEAGVAAAAVHEAELQKEIKKQEEQAAKAAALKKKLEAQKELEDNWNNAADAVGNFGSALSNLGSSFEIPELNVAGTIAKAIASISLGFAQALSKESKGGIWYWIAAGAAGLAQLAALISQLHGITGYASGGIISGGKSVGDKNLVRVNSGEMILNQGQQGRLWNMINSNSTIGNQPNTTGQVEFKLRGADLYGSFKNYKTLAKKQ